MPGFLSGLGDLLLGRAATPALESTGGLDLADDGLNLSQVAAPAPAQPGLLSRLGSYLMSPEGRLAIGTTLRASNGNDRAFDDQRAIMASRAKEAERQQSMQALRDKNDAFFQSLETDPKTGRQTVNFSKYTGRLRDLKVPVDVAADAKALKDLYNPKRDDYTLGNQRFSGDDNQVLATGTPEDKIVAVQPGGFVARVPMGDQGATQFSAPGGATPAASQPQGRAPAGGVRNNPGNIENGDFARSLPGYVPSAGRFAQFSTPEAGRNAQVALLDSYGRKGVNTVAGIISRWAPDTENDTPAYIANVAQALGVDPNAPLDMADSNVQAKLADAIARQEHGGGGGAGRSAPGGAQMYGGTTVVAQGAPKPGYHPSTPQELALARLPPDTPAQTSPEGKVEPITLPGGAGGGKLGATALKLQQDNLEALQTASSINTRLGRTVEQLDAGGLNLGPVENVLSNAQNFVGRSTEESRNFSSLKATLEKLRNDSLRLNKGVQTEGDAQRAWKELLSNLNDPELVRQRLEEIQDLNDQAIAFRKDTVAQLRADSGLPPMDIDKFMAQPLPAKGGAGRAPSPAAAQPAATAKSPPLSLLPAGKVVTFANGEVWKNVGGKAVRVK